MMFYVESEFFSRASKTIRIVSQAVFNIYVTETFYTPTKIKIILLISSLCNRPFGDRGGEFKAFRAQKKLRHVSYLPKGYLWMKERKIHLSTSATKTNFV